MSTAQTAEALRERARRCLAALAGDDLAEAKGLVEALLRQREYALMGPLAEAVSRLDPKDARNRRLYAQYLIDTGKVTAAIDMLQPLIRRLALDHPESLEAVGLLGRAYKQLFIDAGDKGSPTARRALRQAIETYRRPYMRDPRNTWHGVNLLALLTRARSLGMRVAPGLDPLQIADEVLATLRSTPESERDAWFLPTLAEASLGLRDWVQIDHIIEAYANAPGVSAFQIASTLRQFTEVWNLPARDAQGQALVDMLRARLLCLQGGELQLGSAELQQAIQRPVPDNSRLEAILGTYGAQTFRWWKTGLERARAVAAIRSRVDGARVGTGFLLLAGKLGLAPDDEAVVLTNFHVVNPAGADAALRPEDAEIVFEAVDPGSAYAVSEVIWSSPPDRHDASVLRLARRVEGIEPLPVAAALPTLESGACVYVIGHPGGRELAFSFQDNELLDHEGPPAGQPQGPGVCRLHYRAPTEGGSSGSPVFNSRLWQVVALHHKGGKLGMPRLNGKPGSYAANEGIAIQSIVAAIRG